jgi:hypothetical protein
MGSPWRWGPRRARRWRARRRCSRSSSGRTAKNRTTLAPALSLWLLLERLDRERGPTLIASSVDSLATAKGVMPPGVADALAVIEQRRPGRLETVHPQSPRGRATLASAIARAYRAIGGMRDERRDG